MEIIKCDHGQDLPDSSAGYHVLTQMIKESLFRPRYYFLKELEFGKKTCNESKHSAVPKRGKQGQK